MLDIKFTNEELQSLKIENQENYASFDFQTTKDLFEKMKYDFNKLSNKNSNPYDILNFCFDANHLKDWVWRENKLNIVQMKRFKKIIMKKVDNLYLNKEFGVIVSVCNRSKHFTLDKQEYEVKKIKKVAEDKDFHYFLGNGDKAGIYYYVKIDGKEIDFYSICNKVYMDWIEVFEGKKNNIL